MSELEITHEDNPNRGGFYMHRGGDKVGEITYTHMGDGKISMDHTWVTPSLRGKGLARQLFDRSVEWARESDLKMVPYCSYVVAQFANDPSLEDLRA